MQQIIFGLITPTLALVFAATFLLLWRQGRMGRHVLAFAGSYTMLSLGLFIVHLEILPASISLQITHAIYSASAFLMLWGAGERVGVKIPLPLMVAVYGVFALALLPTIALTPYPTPRLVVTNISYGTMVVIGVTMLLASPRRQMMDRLVILVLALNAADFLIRPSIITLSEEAFSVVAYRETVSYSIINLAVTVKTLSTAIVLIAACISDRIAEVREESQRDGLTGLRNRRAFEEEVERRLARAQKENVPISLVVADIDLFKQVNDIWGHQAGDKAITTFGRLLESTVREDDVCGRIGGEEFCIVVWDCNEADATRLAERIRTLFAQLSHEGLSEDIRLTASFGVAQWQAGDSYRNTFSLADAALYRAKENGRNRVESGEPVKPVPGRRASDQADEDRSRAAA